MVVFLCSFFRIQKFLSWVTSCGYASYYVIGAPDPDFKPATQLEQVEQESRSGLFLVFSKEIRADPAGYKGMGMHGSHSGPAFCEAVLSKERMLTMNRSRTGDGLPGGDDFSSTVLTLQAACYVGAALCSIDLARSHALTRVHADTGRKIAEYPMIQVIKSSVPPEKDRVEVVNEYSGFFCLKFFIYFFRFLAFRSVSLF
jgi:alkylation response protein AidB-like acyl-CoA dehydrogenase